MPWIDGEYVYSENDYDYGDADNSGNYDYNYPEDGGYGEPEVLPDVGYQGDTNEENNVSKNPNVSPADASRIPNELGSDITNSINKLLGTSMSGKQLASMMGVIGGGIAGLTGALDPKVTKVGYQGGIPKLTAMRNMITAPPAGRRPGSGGINYGGDVQYFPKGQEPSSGDFRSAVIAPPPGSYSGDAPSYMSKGSTIADSGIQSLMNKKGLDGSPVYNDEISRNAKMTIGDEGALNGAARTSNDASRMEAMLQNYAQGGLTNLAHGRYLQGETDGMADKIPAQIGEDQPAALSHGEFVIPADVVSHLGNGNSDAGAKKLYQMMDKIRMARTGSKKQGREIDADKFMPGGLAKAYSQGGGVKHFLAGGDTGSAVASGITGTEQAPASWVGEYVTDMLGKGQALANMPYQQYTGPLTAGASNLQNQAFGAASNLAVPTSVGAAANTAGNIAAQAQNSTYTPGTFTNQYAAPTPYQATTFSTDKFNAQQAQQYMDPFLQASLNPQIAEAKRQAAIKQQETDAQMAKSGAYGGGRSAVMAAAANRNLATGLADITGKGYSAAYKNAMDQFNADQQRALEAAKASESSKQFGSTQGMTAAELKAKYGQDAAKDTESSRQFGATQGLSALKTALDATRAQGDLGISGADLNLRNIKAQADLGATERGIESEGIAADRAQFEEARKHPYDMVTFQQSLLNGLPITAQNYQMSDPNWLTKMAGGATTAQDLIDILSGNKPAKKV